MFRDFNQAVVVKRAVLAKNPIQISRAEGGSPLLDGKRPFYSRLRECGTDAIANFPFLHFRSDGNDFACPV